MKIWHKTLISLGTIGVIAGSVAVGFSVGYKDYQYNKHFGRGTFNTALPTQLSDYSVAKEGQMFFADPQESFVSLTTVDQNGKTSNGQNAKDYAKSYLSQHGQQPYLVVNFAGTRFVNDIPLYITPETFVQFVDWFVKKGEWGPEISSLDEIKVSGKSTEDGTLGAFSTDFETSSITYYVGQFFGSVNVASTYEYNPVGDIFGFMSAINSARPGLMMRLNRKPMVRSDVQKLINEMNKANKGHAHKMEIYSVEKINTIEGVSYYNVFLDNSHGLLHKIEKLMPTSTSEVSDTQISIDANGNMSLNSNAKKFPSFGKLTILDLMNLEGQLEHGISVDFLKYTIIHEYGHHQSNTAGSSNSGRNPVISGDVDVNTMGKATSWGSIDVINNYFEARAPRLRAVRCNSFMHVAPAHADPATYPFIAIQYKEADSSPEGFRWHTMTSQEIFQLQSFKSVDASESLVNKRSFKDITDWGKARGLTAIESLLLFNMDPFVNTKIPRRFVPDALVTYQARDNSVHRMSLTDEHSSLNGYKWATQFKYKKADGKSDYIFNAPVAHPTKKAKVVNDIYDKETFLKSSATGIVKRADVLYVVAKQMFGEHLKNAASNHEVFVPEISTTFINDRKAMMEACLSEHNGKFYFDKTKMTSEDFFVQATKDYMSSVELSITPIHGKQITETGKTYTYIDKTTATVTVGGTSTPIAVQPSFAGFYDLSAVTKDATGYKFDSHVFPYKSAYYPGDTFTPPTGIEENNMMFNSKSDAINFLKTEAGTFVYSFILRKNVIHKAVVDGNHVNSDYLVAVNGELEWPGGGNNMATFKPSSQEAMFSYEISLNELLTRDYVQTLYDTSMAHPLPSIAKGVGHVGMDEFNPLATGAELDPNIFINAFAEKYKEEQAKVMADYKLVAKALETSTDKDLISNTIFEAAGSGITAGGILNDTLWNIYASTPPITAGNPVGGIMDDVSMRHGLDWDMYDSDGNPVIDNSIRIKDLQDNVVTNRVLAYWMFVLHNKGIYGSKEKDCSVAGIWHSKEKDASYMWGYIPTGTDAKNITFTDESGKVRSFKLNFGDNLRYNEKQFDASTAHTLRDDGYIGWSIDYKTMGTYKDADLPAGNYKVTFTDANGNEVKRADGSKLFSLGQTKYITNNNMYHGLAPTVFENLDSGETIFRVRNYF